MNSIYVATLPLIPKAGSKTQNGRLSSTSAPHLKKSATKFLCVNTVSDKAKQSKRRKKGAGFKKPL